MAPLSPKICHAGLELTAQEDRKAGEWLSEYLHPLSALTFNPWVLGPLCPFQVVGR